MKFVLVKDRMPEKSCEVIGVSAYGNTCYGVMNLSYSAKYKKFNCQDWYTPEEAASSEFDSVVAWCLMSELKAEIKSLMKE